MEQYYIGSESISMTSDVMWEDNSVLIFLDVNARNYSLSSATQWEKNSVSSL